MTFLLSVIAIAFAAFAAALSYPPATVLLSGAVAQVSPPLANKITGSAQRQITTYAALAAALIAGAAGAISWLVLPVLAVLIYKEYKLTQDAAIAAGVVVLSVVLGVMLSAIFGAGGVLIGIIAIVTYRVYRARKESASS